MWYSMTYSIELYRVKYGMRTSLQVVLRWIGISRKWSNIHNPAITCYLTCNLTCYILCYLWILESWPDIDAHPNWKDSDNSEPWAFLCTTHTPLNNVLRCPPLGPEETKVLKRIWLSSSTVHLSPCFAGMASSCPRFSAFWLSLIVPSVLRCSASACSTFLLTDSVCLSW